MPAFLAASASALPTAFACSVFEPESATPFQLAEARVRPASSSISCALIPRFERNTTRRGRSAVPATLPRTRRWRRRRAWRFVRTLMRGLLAHGRGGGGGTGGSPTLSRRRGLVGETWFLPRTRA